MKFTKQEQSLIKLAAAHMAPQMLKKATLQDKLAEYGIGLKKQAAPASEATTPNTTTTYGWSKDKETESRGPIIPGFRNTLLPQLGHIMPTDVKDRNLDALKYPYTYARMQAAKNSGNKNALSDVRLFDNVVDRVMKRDGGDRNYPRVLGPVPTQDQVNWGRTNQAFGLAKRIAGDNTNQFRDAEKMLMQAGKNNQEAFETTGTIPKYEPGKAPAGYEGTNSLSPEQMERILKLFPAMGATGNPRRFANWS